MAHGHGLAGGENRTIVRNNVFIKNDQPSPDGDRPNLYLGGVPATGPGSSDLYEVYGNLFFHNPRESLLQVEGRVTIHDNVFVDAFLAAITVQMNDLPVELADVYNNTIYTATAGIHFSQAATQGDFVVGNLVFAATPIGGSITVNHDNVTDTVANAGMYVNMPSMTLGAMDFYPSGSLATGPSMDLSPVSSDTDYAVDFNGTSKGAFTYRGAYAGMGTNPGWPLGDGTKTSGAEGRAGPRRAGRRRRRAERAGRAGRAARGVRARGVEGQAVRAPGPSRGAGARPWGAARGARGRWR